MKKIFISYSRRDAGDFATQIQRHLSSFNYDIFTDVDSIRAGEVWSNKIEENISNCDIFVVIVTHGALQSPHVEKEVLQAQKEKKTIVPCFHSGTRTRYIKWELNKIQGVEFTNEYQLARDLFLKIDTETIDKPPEGRNGTKTHGDLSRRSAQWYLDKGKEWESVDENEKALKQYENAIKREPENFLVRCELSFFLERIGKTNEALEAIEQAIDLKPTNAEVWYHKARILEKLEQYEEAIIALTKDLKLDSKDVKSWTSKGRLLDKVGRHEEALESFDQILKLEPDNTDAKKNKEVAIKELKKQKYANLMYEIISQIENKNYSKVIELCDKAIEIKAIEIYPNNYHPYLYKGNALKELNRYGEAIKCYDQVLEIDSKNVESLNNKGLVLHKLGKYQDAIYFYEKVLDIYPKKEEAIKNKEISIQALNKEKVTSVLNKIEKCYENKDYSTVLELFNENEDPVNNPILQKYKCNALYNLAKYDQALECYENVLKIDSQNIDILYQKANVLEKLEKYEEAITIIDELLKLSPNMLRYLDKKVQLLTKLEHHEEPTYYKSLKTKPNNANIKQNKKIVLDKIKETMWYKLINDIARGMCIPFVGPGVCQPWIPLGKEIASKWAHEYDYPLRDSHQLSRVAQFLAIQYGNSFTKEKLKNEFKTIKSPDFSLEQFRNEPLSVLADLNLPIYITTNYDHFLEEALKSKGKMPISEFCRWNEELSEYANDNRINTNLYRRDGELKITSSNPLIYHLHGDIDHPPSMVLTEKDFIDFNTFFLKKNETNVLPLSLRRVLSGSSLLFIGYNLDDLNLDDFNFRSILQNGLISFMFTLSSKGYNIAIIQFLSNEYNDVEEVVKYSEKYTANVFNIQILWNNIREFMQELQFRLEEFKNKSL